MTFVVPIVVLNLAFFAFKPDVGDALWFVGGLVQAWLITWLVERE